MGNTAHLKFRRRISLTEFHGYLQQALAATFGDALVLDGAITDKGSGFEVANVTGATLYPTKEAAELVASHLQGDMKIHELPVEASKDSIQVGPRWITETVPRPSAGNIATLKVILRDLRATAEFNHKLEGEATDAQSREWHALARFGAEAHARVMLDMLTYFGVTDLPAPLNLPRHPNLKVTP